MDFYPGICRLRFAFNTTSKPQWSDPEGKRTYSLAVPEQRKAARQAAWDIGARMTGDIQHEFVDEVEKSLDIEPGGLHHGFMMTWDQVRALRKAGHTIGAHTLSHPNVAHLSQSEARFEIIECKKTLEEELGEQIDHFSYPHPALNPEWSAQTLEITREAGFKSAVLTTPDTCVPGTSRLPSSGFTWRTTWTSSSGTCSVLFWGDRSSRLVGADRRAILVDCKH